jgi:predicted CXXCH cytochrome family protein
MEPKYIKPAIAGGVIFILIILLAMSGAGEKFGRLITVGGLIATNLANAPHGDPRPLEEMDKKHIKATTGSSKVVDINELPKAFRPMKKYGHPPFTLGACNVCHASRTDKPAAITTRTVAKLCYTCHYPKDKINKRMAALDCNKCHSPHHADRKKLVRNKVTDRKCPVGKFQEN